MAAGLGAPVLTAVDRLYRRVVARPGRAGAGGVGSGAGCAARSPFSTLSAESGAALKGTMVRVGQSSEEVAAIYQHSDDERQRDRAGDTAESPVDLRAASWFIPWA